MYHIYKTDSLPLKTHFPACRVATKAEYSHFYETHVIVIGQNIYCSETAYQEMILAKQNTNVLPPMILSKEAEPQFVVMQGLMDKMEYAIDQLGAKYMGIKQNTGWTLVKGVPIKNLLNIE